MEYFFDRRPETPGEVSQSSTNASDESNTKTTDMCNVNEQRNHAQHARHLPSRTLAILSKVKQDKIGNVVGTISYNTVRIPRRGDIWPVEEQAENIASHMELHNDLMQDDPISEMRRLETLREMPQCLTVKRSIRAKLRVSINRRSKKKSLGYSKRLRYAISMSFTKIGVTMKEVLTSVELWYHAIKTIEGHFGSGVATYFKFLRWLFILNTISFLLSTCFVTVPQSFVKIADKSEFGPWDIFVGNGYLENTILYYGFYGNETIEINPGYTYDLPSAYFLTLTCCYIFTFILLSIKVARSYRKCYIETSGGIHNPYASKIFCGWDFGVSSYKTASLRSSMIYRELKELLAESKERIRPNFFRRLATLFYQCGITILVFALMAGITWSLWLILVKHETQNTDLWSFLLVPFVVTCIMHLFPLVVSLFVKMEQYSNKRTALYVTMIRVSTMTAAIVSVLLVYWLTYSSHNCWQNDLAQEIYRLVILDFFVSIIGDFLIQATRYRLHKCFPTKVSAPKFEIASNTLNLIYNQILFWVAFYFSPPLSLVIVLKVILIFYIKKFALMRYCEPPSTSWRAAQTQTLFLALAFVAMTAILVTLGYVITSVKSGGCGPFRNHDFTWEIIVDRVLKLKRDSEFWIVVTNLAKPGTGAAILIAMSIGVYCLRAKAEASKALVHILREMLVLQSRDKDFLLKEFSKVADENWLRRRTNFDLRRETSAALFDQDIEMSVLSKGFDNSEKIQNVGNFSLAGTPSTSKNQ